MAYHMDYLIPEISPFTLVLVQFEEVRKKTKYMTKSQTQNLLFQGT